MNTLHVRSVPEDLYRRLKQLAVSQNRSLSAQVIEMLSHAVDDDSQRMKQSAILASIRRRRFTPPPQVPSSVELLKEDRER